MNGMICPRHDDRIRELLLGLLDDAEAVETEALIGSCPECTAWYEQQCAGEAFETVEASVGNAILSCSLPPLQKRHRSQRLWVRIGALAAAACLILVVGLHRTHQKTVTPQSIARIDFEQPAAVHGGVLKIRVENSSTQRAKNSGKADRKTPAVDSPARHSAERLFSDGVEDGSLKGWSLHT